MQVSVHGRFGVQLFESKEPSSLIIYSDDGKPVVIYQFTPNKKGYFRYSKGEDKDFDQILRHLNLD